MRHLVIIAAAAAGLSGSASWSQTAPSATTAAAGVICTKLNAGGHASGEAVLTINVNGQDVGTFDGGVYSDLEHFMTPGPNTIKLTFSGSDKEVMGRLRCKSPGQTNSGNDILSLRPSTNRLTAQAQVNYVPQ